MTTTRAMIACLCTLLALALAPVKANAQDLSPTDILDASKQALAEIGGFRAQLKLSGEGGMFTDTLPSMTGILFYGAHDEWGRVIHVVGESKDRKEAPSVPIDMLIANDRYVWLDREKQTINETRNQHGIRGNPTYLTMILLDSIINEDPFARDANNAQSIEHVGQETINGVLCDQIAIKLAEKKKGRPSAGQPMHTDAVWSIGAADRLPRKIVQISGTDSFVIRLVFELSNLKILDQVDPNNLDIMRPEGFKFLSKLPKPRPENEPGDEKLPEADDELPAPKPQGQRTPTPPAPKGPAVTMAPPYSFTPQGKSEVSNATQQGRVTVLYFWGSWCVPCVQSSPLVSTLTTDFASDPVDVFGLAIREANPRQTENDFRSSGYAHALAINPTQVASAFKVRVYPTIAVINRHDEIVFQEGIGRDVNVERLIEHTREAVRKALADE